MSPLFERRDSNLDLVAVLAILEMYRLARGQSCLHLVELVSIAAQPANQETVGDGVAFVEAIALPARVKDRMHRAIARAH